MGAEESLKLTVEETAFQKLNRHTYNSGKMKEAYEQAADFYASNPCSLFAKFVYAGMAGDYSDDKTLPADRRSELLDTAKKLIKEVYDDANIQRYSFCSSVRNEYFWFYQLHAEQYALGVERVSAGELRGYYSMCVGASAMAKKYLLVNKDLPGAVAWAEKSRKAFHEFEKVDPAWNNINYYYAYALAVSGDSAGAVATFKDMYRKQNAPIKENELKDFLTDVEIIENARNKMG